MNKEEQRYQSIITHIENGGQFGSFSMADMNFLIKYTFFHTMNFRDYCDFIFYLLTGTLPGWLLMIIILFSLLLSIMPL